jgi:hypothetical protein
MGKLYALDGTLGMKGERRASRVVDDEAAPRNSSVRGRSERDDASRDERAGSTFIPSSIEGVA